MARAVVALRETSQIARKVAAALADVLPELKFLLTDVRGQVLTVSGADWSAEGARLPWANEGVLEVVERSLSAEELAKLAEILGEPQAAGRLFAGSLTPVSMVVVGSEAAVGRVETDWQVNAAWHVLSTGVHRIRVENALAQSQRMDALGRLSAGIAHDFNNLLTSILGGAELAARRVKGDATAEKYIAGLSEAAQRAAGLTSKLMAFTASATEGPRVIEVVGLVSGILPVLRRSVEERIEIVVAVPDQEVWVLADPLELERALLNLVVNARDAIAGQGEIEVGVEIRPAVGAPQRTDDVVIWVADTGVGIPAELHGKVFEPFFSTRRERGASGLGLSIVYGVVQSMGGEVMLASEPGEGTRVEILLAQRSPGPLEAPSDPVAGSVLGGRHILVVEDDPDVRETVCEMLAVGGFSVHTADNGIAALQALDTSGPFSLVLSDVVMPQMGGFELARRIASRSDSPPIALVSGYAPTIQPGEEELRIPMIAKPFTLKRLLAFVEELVEA
jgi:signal transduction histidine kinase/CheY-like chemotaxis protein